MPTMTKAAVKNERNVHMIKCWVNIAAVVIRACLSRTIVLSVTEGGKKEAQTDAEGHPTSFSYFISLFHITIILFNLTLRILRVVFSFRHFLHNI